MPEQQETPSGSSFIDLDPKAFGNKSREEAMVQAGDLKQIAGLMEFLSQESWGGNAKGNRAAANAIYQKGEANNLITFTNYEFEGQGINMRLVVGMSPYAFQLLQEGVRVLPPELIQKVSVSGAIEEKDRLDIIRQVNGHNTRAVLLYLRNGGELKYLPETPFLPSPEEIQKLQSSMKD